MQPGAMSAVIEALPVAEQETLCAFHQALAPDEVGAIEACWWVRSYHHNVTEAVRACRASAAWRAAQDFRVMCQEPSEPDHVRHVLDNVFSPRLIEGLDRAGRPILYMPYGRVDLVGLERQGVAMEYLVRRYTLCLERVRLAVLSAPNPLAGHLQIADVAGTNAAIAMRSWHFFATISAISQENYPELLGCCCVIRAPATGQRMFGMAQRLMSAESRAKVQLHSGDPRHALRALITDEVLPAVLAPMAGGDTSGWRCFPRCCESKPPPPPTAETEQTGSAADEGADWASLSRGLMCGGGRELAPEATEWSYSSSVYSFFDWKDWTWKDWTWESMGCVGVRRAACGVARREAE